MRQRIRARYTATMDPRVLTHLDLIRGIVSRSAIIEEAVIIELLRRKIVQEEYERYNHDSAAKEVEPQT